ncbi:MAG: glycerol dehydrogenase [Eubacterium sp.]
MAKILISPSKYIQGPGELDNLATYVSALGKNALCLITDSGLKRNKTALDESFDNSDVSVIYDAFNRECCQSEISRIMDVCKENNIDIVIGVGGGKTFDTIKAVGYYLDLPVVIVPTIASTDAPCSALSVIYTEDGVFDSYLFLKQNPNIILVDTTIIANSPTRLVVAGMGDALATYFEARACEASNASTCAAGTTTLAAQALAELCYNTLIDEGYMAKLAADSKSCTRSLEKIIEANTLLSGIGFESGGLAGAHAVHNGFTVLPECHHMYHGEKVAFGTLVQLALEDAPMDEISEVLDFCITVGLPVTLKELGIEEITEEKIRAVAEASAVADESIHNMPFEVTADSVYAAIMVADALGRDYLA